MLFQSLRALCLTPGGPGRIWNHLEAPVRSIGVSGSFACGFQTDLPFADTAYPRCMTKNCLLAVDSHFQSWVASISHLFLIKKAAITSEKNNNIPLSTVSD
jgi:hypothetical protein